MRAPVDNLFRVTELLSARPEYIVPMYQVLQELLRAESLYPSWPADPVHASAILCEESGECLKECNNFYFDEKDVDPKVSLKNMEKEAVQSAAMGIRFLLGLKDYKRQSEE